MKLCIRGRHPTRHTMAAGLVLLLAPLALFAQVEIDTIIRLPTGMRQGFYLQDLNKLYVNSYAEDQFLVLDCSTYQLKAQIPVKHEGFARYSYNWRRQKLYVNFGEGTDSTLVLDAAGDSILKWLGVYRASRNEVYLSDLDVRFKPAEDTLYEYECDVDTIIRRWPMRCTYASWDSVDHKLYVGQGSLKRLYVYDYLADSCLKVIDVGAIYARMPDACVFNYEHHRAYVSHSHVDYTKLEVGIVDTERDTLVRVLSANAEYGLFTHVAVDQRDGKAYIAAYPDTMWVVDCATDSVLKKFECAEGGRTDLCIRWVPWSNRIYSINYLWGERYLVIIDCNTDSIIWSRGMYLGPCQDIQLDPVHQRIFLIGAPDTNSITVLRDTGYGGVAEAPHRPGATVANAPTVVRGVLNLQPAIYNLQSDISLLSVDGRKILDLSPGPNDISRLSPGVYFVRPAQAQAPAQAIRKVVVTR